MAREEAPPWMARLDYLGSEINSLRRSMDSLKETIRLKDNQQEVVESLNRTIQKLIGRLEVMAPCIETLLGNKVDGRIKTLSSVDDIPTFPDNAPPKFY